MNNLEQLVKQYKRTKDKEILNQIYSLLNFTIKKKAKYIYERKYFPFNLYHKCKYCRNCKKTINQTKNQRKIICENCEICKCEKGAFNLKQKNLCNLEDVEQDIWIFILETINNYDIKRPFNEYLYSGLWNYIPSFLTQNFVDSIKNKTLDKIIDNREIERNLLNSQNTENNLEIESKEIAFNIKRFLTDCESEKEKEIIRMYMENNKITEEEIGKKLGITHQAVSLILKKIRKKLKKYLQK